MKKLKQLILTLAIALTPLTSVSALTPAQTTNGSPLLNGQNHYYTVQLRSDKKSLVYARIIFSNPSSDQDLSTYEFSLPDGVNVANLSAQQILAKYSGDKTCKTYETIEDWRARVNRTYAQNDTAYNSTKQCLTWDEPQKYDVDFDYNTNTSSSNEYYSYSYYRNRDSKFDYADLELKNTDRSYAVTLSEPVKPKKQGSILLSFTTDSFIDGGFIGRYTYDVKTLLTKQMIDRATVAVNFDQDMFTREAEQKRTYETKSSSSSLAQGADAAKGAVYESRSMDILQNKIGRGGVYVKTQSALIPGDILSVTGVFATNSSMLFLNEILITILILLLILGTLWMYHIWRKGHPRAKKTTESKPNTKSTKVTNKEVFSFTEYNDMTPWREMVVTSAASIVGTIILILALSGLFSSMGSGTTSDSMFVVFGTMVAIFFGVLVLPLLYVMRYGVKNAFKWAFIQLGVILVLMLFMNSLFSEPSPRYYNYEPNINDSSMVID